MEYLDWYGDSEAAMVKERKCSSCVVIRLGQSVLETSSPTQGVISLSSGEAELQKSVVRVRCVYIAIQPQLAA